MCCPSRNQNSFQRGMPLWNLQSGSRAACYNTLVFQTRWLLPDKLAQVCETRRDVRILRLTLIIAEPAMQTVLDPSLFYVYQDLAQQQPLSIPVWEARPVHYPATCKYDQIVLDLLANLKPIHQTGGNALEFANPSFPHISALLNPQQHAMIFPLATEIVSVSLLSFGNRRWLLC
jgi:hypothetical protein